MVLKNKPLSIFFKIWSYWLCLRGIKLVNKIIRKTRMVVQDNLSSPLFALVTYRHVRNWITHLLDGSQTKSCSDSKQFFFNIYEPTFQFMIFTLANDHFIVWPSSVTLTFNLLEQMVQMNNCAKLFWNQCINIQVMTWTSSIYDHSIISPSSVALTFNLPEKMFQMPLLLLMEIVPNNYAIHV